MVFFFIFAPPREQPWLRGQLVPPSTLQRDYRAPPPTTLSRTGSPFLRHGVLKLAHVCGVSVLWPLNRCRERHENTTSFDGPLRAWWCLGVCGTRTRPYRAPPAKDQPGVWDLGGLFGSQPRRLQGLPPSLHTTVPLSLGPLKGGNAPACCLAVPIHAPLPTYTYRHD